MKQLPLQEQYAKLEDIKISAFGYELIREVLLPEILGKDTASVLYWAGKSLARKYPLETVEEIISFFGKAGWGTLTVAAERKDEIEFELASPLITARFSLREEHTFQLEAGFLAQQIEQQKKYVTEAYEKQKKLSKKVVFTVKWDQKDSLE